MINTFDCVLPLLHHYTLNFHNPPSLQHTPVLIPPLLMTVKLIVHCNQSLLSLFEIRISFHEALSIKGMIIWLQNMFLSFLLYCPLIIPSLEHTRGWCLIFYLCSQYQIFLHVLHVLFPLNIILKFTKILANNSSLIYIIEIEHLEMPCLASVCVRYPHCCMHWRVLWLQSLAGESPNTSSDWSWIGKSEMSATKSLWILSCIEKACSQLGDPHDCQMLL